MLFFQQLSRSWLQDVDDYSKDYVERDEKRLADLGRRAVEMFAISHIFTDLQVQTSLFLPTVTPFSDIQNVVTKVFMTIQD